VSNMSTVREGRLHICFLSNCYGEDRIAALIARELKKLRPEIKITGAPLISGGGEYIKRGIPLLTRGKIPPSGGFPARSLKGFLLDLSVAHGPLRYFLTLRKMRTDINCAVVVGDVPLLVLGYLALRKEILFLASAKSDYQRPHYRIEEFFMGRISSKVLTRDEYTAQNLRKKGMSALFLGNPMMDELVSRGINLGKPPIVGILPGSRSEAYKNFIKMLRVVEKVKEKVTFVCALPQSLEIGKIINMAKKDKWVHENGVLKKNERTVLVVRNGFEDVISKSEIILGLAGTANEQAVGLGKPVISFTGYGPQTTLRRMKDQARLLGGAVKFVSNFPNGVVSEISFLLSSPEERIKRGKIGSLRMGPPGGAERISNLIVKEFNL